MEKKLWKIAGAISALAVISAAVYLAVSNYELICDYLKDVKEKLFKSCPLKRFAKGDGDDFEDDFMEFENEQETETCVTASAEPAQACEE